MKDLMKNPFPLPAIAVSTRKNIYKNPRKWFQRAGIIFFFKYWPTFNFKNGVHWQNKSKRVVINQKPFPLARMKYSLKHTISVD